MTEGWPADDDELDAAPGSFDAVAEQARLAAFLATLEDDEDDIGERMDTGSRASSAAELRTSAGSPSSSSGGQSQPEGMQLPGLEQQAGALQPGSVRTDLDSNSGQGADVVHRRMPSRYPRRRPLTRR